MTEPTNNVKEGISSEIIAAGDATKAAEVILQHTTTDHAINFVANILNYLDDSKKRKNPDYNEEEESNKQLRSESYDGEGEKLTFVDGSNFIDVALNYYDYSDSLDTNTITLCVAYQNDLRLSSHMIGKQGSTVVHIRNSTGAKIQLQSNDTASPHQDRHVFFLGTIKAVIQAYQMMHVRMQEMPTMSKEEKTKVVIPFELCAHIIGKQGAVIKQIMQTSGSKTVVQTEPDMLAAGPQHFGRVVFITGTFQQRIHSMLLILRKLLQAREYPSNWRGSLPLPQLQMPAAPPTPFAQPNMGRYMGFQQQQAPTGFSATMPPTPAYAAGRGRGYAPQGAMPGMTAPPMAPGSSPWARPPF